jgi:hypothetical protein
MEENAMEQESTLKERVVCPLCSAWAERGSVYAADKGSMRWIPGEANWKKKKAAWGAGEQVGECNVFSSGVHAQGIRCHSCRRIILDW